MTDTYVNTNHQKGFTIVELLIVIVVIGILAAITIVAFNGVQNRGKASAAQSAAVALDKKVESYNAVNGFYPTTTGTITGTATQNSITTATTSEWYSAPNSGFSSTAATAASAGGVWSGLAAPSDSKTVYYTNGNTANGGCVWWYDYANTTWKSTAAGTVTCALPAAQTGSLASVAL